MTVTHPSECVRSFPETVFISWAWFKCKSETYIEQARPMAKLTQKCLAVNVI